jgi:hypothetical protein
MIDVKSFNRTSPIIWIFQNIIIHHKNASMQYELESRSSEVYSIQNNVILFVSDFRQVGGFLQVLRFPPLIKLTNTI